MVADEGPSKVHIQYKVNTVGHLNSYDWRYDSMICFKLHHHCTTILSNTEHLRIFNHVCTRVRAHVSAYALTHCASDLVQFRCLANVPCARSIYRARTRFWFSLQSDITNNFKQSLMSSIFDNRAWQPEKSNASCSSVGNAMYRLKNPRPNRIINFLHRCSLNSSVHLQNISKCFVWAAFSWPHLWHALYLAPVNMLPSRWAASRAYLE